MTILNIYQLKSRLSFYAREVQKGKSFTVAYRNRPFAVLRPLESHLTAQFEVKFGVLKGLFEVPDSFNEPLVEFENDLYKSPGS